MPDPVTTAGTVVVITGKLMRYVDFSMSLLGLKTPPNCQLTWQQGVSIATNCNRAVRERRGEWVWLLGDDHVFQADTLMRLLAHDVDLVAPLVYKRNLPLRPVAYQVDSANVVQPLRLDQLPPNGLLPVAAVGGAGLLVKSAVFDAMPPPWFEMGKTRPDALGEDIWFCEKARQLGFACYLDLDTSMAHTTPMHIWPLWRNGAWGAEVEIDTNQRLQIDAASQKSQHPATIENRYYDTQADWRVQIDAYNEAMEPL